MTAAAYLVASTVVAAVLGGMLGAAAGAAASLVEPSAAVLLAGAASVCCLAAAAEAFPRTVPLPTPRRQVNEEWLGRYRGWVYGIGFGGQLGLGVATIVTTAAVYASLALATLAGWSAGGPGHGATAGTAVLGAFGVVRALPVFATGRIRTGHGLRALHRRLDAAGLAARRATTVGLLLSAVVLALVVRR
jgi:hypothetical protein